MKLIDADARVTVTIYDEEHKEHIRWSTTVKDVLETYTDGCPPIIEVRNMDVDGVNEL